MNLENYYVADTRTNNFGEMKLAFIQAFVYAKIRYKK